MYIGLAVNPNAKATDLADEPRVRNQKRTNPKEPRALISRGFPQRFPCFANFNFLTVPVAWLGT